MHYLGTNFSLTLGAWRLRFVLALEDAPNEGAEADEQRRGHAGREHAPHIMRIDSHAASQRRN